MSQPPPPPPTSSDGLNAPPALPSLAGWKSAAPPTPRAIPEVAPESIFSSFAPVETPPAEPEAPTVPQIETPSLTLAATAPLTPSPAAPSMPSADQPAMPQVAAPMITPSAAPAVADVAPAAVADASTPTLAPVATPAPAPALPQAGQPAAPAVDPMAPAVDPMAPAVDPMAPAVDPMAPAVDPMAPAVDPMAPAGAAVPSVPAPQLPTIAAPPPAAATPAAQGAALPGTEGLTFQQIQAIQAAQSGQPGPRPTAARRVPQRSVGQQVKRVVLASVLVAGLGAGARFGFDEYEKRQAASEANDAQAAGIFLPAIGEGLPTAPAERPNDRFMHVVVKVEGAGSLATTTIRRDLASGSMTIDEAGNDEGEPYAYMMDVRGDTIVARLDSSSPWVPVSDDPSFTSSVDESRELSAGAIMFSDVVPPEMVPYIRVMSETEETLPVVPLDTVVEEPADDEEDRGISTSGNSDPMLDDVINNVVPVESSSPSTRAEVVRPAAPATVRHYQIELDTAAFSEQYPFMYADAFFGVRFDEPIDLWVDSLGIVRQIGLGGESGASIVFTYYDIAPALPGFQDSVIVSTPMVQQEN